jgi:hypothetical protein
MMILCLEENPGVVERLPSPLQPAAHLRALWRQKGGAKEQMIEARLVSMTDP